MVSDLFRGIMFFLSPFLSIPFILHGIYKRSKNSVFLFVFLISIVSFLYFPSLSNDKAYYYMLYDAFSGMSWEKFTTFLFSEKTDFIFYLLIYLFSYLTLPLKYFFLLVTAATVSLWMSFFLKISGKLYQSKHFFLYFLLFVFSFSPAGLFSGVRFYLAISMVLYGFSFTILDRGKKYKGVLYVIAGALTHFSCTIYVPVIIFFTFTSLDTKFYHILLLCSFAFCFVPREFFLSQVHYFSLAEAYQYKVTSYLGEKDYIENSLLVGNFHNFLKFFFKTFWVYFAYLYVIRYKKQHSKVKNAFLVALSTANIFYSAPTVYNRYLILALGFFIVLLIRDRFYNGNTLVYVKVLFIILALNFFGNIYGMRYNFVKSISSLYSVSFPTMLLKKDIKYNDIR